MQLMHKASAIVGVFKTSSNETRPAAECARPYNKHCPMKQGLQLVRKASATVGVFKTSSNETRPAASAQGQAREKRCEIFRPHNGLRETHVAVMAGLQGDCAVADGLGHLPWLRAHVRLRFIKRCTGVFLG